MQYDDNEPLFLEPFQETAAQMGLSREAVQTLKLASFANKMIIYRPDTSDEGVLAHSFDNDIFLTGVPEYVPAAGHIVLDVGAHIGDFSLLLTDRVARIYAVEARGDTVALLRANILLNNAENVVADHVAFSADNGMGTLFHAPKGQSWGDSTTFNYDQGSETVRFMTLQRYFSERNIDRIDFAKFNCEGAEFPIILCSETETLAKIRTMLILYHCDLASQFEASDLISKLQSSGFETKVRNRTEKRGWIIAQQSCYLSVHSTASSAT